MKQAGRENNWGGGGLKLLSNAMSALWSEGEKQRTELQCLVRGSESSKLRATAGDDWRRSEIIRNEEKKVKRKEEKPNEQPSKQAVSRLTVCGVDWSFGVFGDRQTARF